MQACALGGRGQRAGEAGAGAASGLGGGGAQAGGGARSLSVQDNEKRLVREALLKARGNRTQAAKLMCISRRTLHRKLAEFPELDVTD